MCSGPRTRGGPSPTHGPHHTAYPSHQPLPDSVERDPSSRTQCQSKAMPLTRALTMNVSTPEWEVAAAGGTDFLKSCISPSAST